MKNEKYNFELLINILSIYFLIIYDHLSLIDLFRSDDFISYFNYNNAGSMIIIIGPDGDALTKVLNDLYGYAHAGGFYYLNYYHFY